MNWDEVLQQDLVGCDLESQEDGHIYRGSISSVRREAGIICFDFAWVARLEDGKWVKWHINAMYVSELTPCWALGDGRLMFTMLGLAVIFPKGGSRLDPTRIQGLKTP